MSLCGLDFGTSNSTIGVLRDGRKLMVPLDGDGRSALQTIMPSAMFFDFEDDQLSFGRKAVELYTQGNRGRLLRSMKSLLGGALMSDGTQFKRQFYTYDEIIGLFVGHLKRQADLFIEGTGEALQSVVMGRPVFFNDKDSALDREAENHLGQIARLAGFKEVSFQFEPIAAALDYEERIRSETLALIIDIGGGTSDFTLVRLSPQRHQQVDRKADFLAHHGTHVGGTDFDRDLSLATVMPEFGLGIPYRDRPSLLMPSHFYFKLATWHEIDLLYERECEFALKDLRLLLSDKQPVDRLLALLKARQGHQLAACVEQAKIELSSRRKTTVDLPALFTDWSDVVINHCELTRQSLQDSVAAQVARIFTAMDETLTQAGVTRAQVNTIFTTGGSTALPMIQQRVQDSFPEAEHVGGDLYNSVGRGLLVEAVKRYS
jgi:hypothetical chaperone protein